MTHERPRSSAESRDATIRASTRRTLVVAFVVILVISAAADALVHHHEHFGIEDAFGFHAWYGLLAGGAAVLLGAGLGRLLRRRNDHRDSAGTRGRSGSGGSAGRGPRREARGRES